MKPPDLSPAANLRLIEEIEKAGSLLAALKFLAGRRMPEESDVLIRGQGLQAFENSRAEMETECELINYAKTSFPEKPTPFSRLPEVIPLPDFLCQLMPALDDDARVSRFREYLLANAAPFEDGVPIDQNAIEEANGAPAEVLERAVKRLVDWMAKEGVSRDNQHDHAAGFRAWEKSNPKEATTSALALSNEAKSEERERRLAEIVRLAPSRENEGGISKADFWRRVGHQIGGSRSTFYRDIGTLVSTGRMKKQKDGKVRAGRMAKHEREKS